MYVIKRTDTNQYFMEWGWMDNPWDGKEYDMMDADGGVDFFDTLDIPCEVECLECGVVATQPHT